MLKENERLQMAYVSYIDKAEATPESYFDVTPESVGLPKWAFDMAEVCLSAKDYGDRSLNSVVWGFLVINLNTENYSNLTDIDWQKATDDWNNNVAEAIIEFIQSDALKLAVLDCMRLQWSYKGGASQQSTNSPRFDDFCTNLKHYIANSDLYSVDAIANGQAIDEDPTSEPLITPDGTKTPKKKGRPIKQSFEATITEKSKRDAVIKSISICLQGKKGKDAVLVICSAMRMGLISKPSYKAFDFQFHPEGVSKTLYNKYLNPNLHSDYEIEGCINALKIAMGE